MFRIFTRYLRRYESVFFDMLENARVMELVDMTDLKSVEQKCSCGFDSHPGYNCYLLRFPTDLICTWVRIPPAPLSN